MFEKTWEKWNLKKLTQYIWKLLFFLKTFLMYACKKKGFWRKTSTFSTSWQGKGRKTRKTLATFAFFPQKKTWGAAPAEVKQQFPVNTDKFLKIVWNISEKNRESGANPALFPHFETLLTVNATRKRARGITKGSDPEKVEKYFRNNSGIFQTQNQTNSGVSEKKTEIKYFWISSL